MEDVQGLGEGLVDSSREEREKKENRIQIRVKGLPVDCGGTPSGFECGLNLATSSRKVATAVNGLLSLLSWVAWDALGYGKTF